MSSIEGELSPQTPNQNPLVSIVLSRLNEGADLGLLLVNQQPDGVEEDAWISAVTDGYKLFSKPMRLRKVREEIETSLEEIRKEINLLTSEHIFQDLGKQRAEELFHKLSHIEARVKEESTFYKLLDTITELQEAIIKYLEKIDLEVEIATIREQMEILKGDFTYPPEFQETLANDLYGVAEALEDRASNIGAPPEIRSEIAQIVHDILYFDGEVTDEY